ncbi:Na(+)/H(+) antiporter subunit C [Nocardioides sp. Y6]|uniref:Na(+)/H(+) antiporter subunit C n=2 Tax=Nocardioides malaquae TaxID=2773426 RepID=A0ABR9RW58_9ACTN|nr:Na(+)/H(+) antiporter subunit C [Nocardioides malaquae]
MVAVAAGLIGCGAYLLLERSLSRVLVGLVMMGNGVSLAFLVAGGPAGRAPIVEGTEGTYVDPLPQAMVLTAIVIMLATVSFVLAMAYRSWQLTGHDDVQDDVEDALIRTMARKDVESESYRAESTEEEDVVAVASDFTVEELAEAAEAAERAEERAAAAKWAEEKAALERRQAKQRDDQEGERK